MTITAGQQDDGTMDVTVSHGTSSSGDPNLTLLDYHRLQTPPMRGMTPEEAAAYKRLKSRIFTRVSRGKEGVMDGIESFHCPLCKCKTTVDFTSHLVERAATIAALTTLLEKSVTLDVWRMTVQEFEKKIASLTDDVDRLTGYSERLNGLRERLEDRNAALTAERDALETATRKVVEAIDRCQSNRGQFSCAPNHDSRCEKDRRISTKCTCGSDELQYALGNPVIMALRRE